MRLVILLESFRRMNLPVCHIRPNNEMRGIPHSTLTPKIPLQLLGPSRRPIVKCRCPLARFRLVDVFIIDTLVREGAYSLVAALIPRIARSAGSGGVGRDGNVWD